MSLSGLCFHALRNSLALRKFSIPNLFSAFRTLCPKHPGSAPLQGLSSTAVGLLSRHSPTLTPLSRDTNPISHTRPSTSVLSGVQPILYPQSYCSLDRSQIHSLFHQEVFLDRLRTPHDATLSNAAAAYRPLDYGSCGWRNQHRIPRRQFSRRLLLSFQGRTGRLTCRNSSDPAERNYSGGSRACALPRPRAARREQQNSHRFLARSLRRRAG